MTLSKCGAMKGESSGSEYKYVDLFLLCSIFNNTPHFLVNTLWVPAITGASLVPF